MKIFIIGMHRSGTSLVTGVLYHCGLYLGENLLMGARDNPKGHFEDRTFIGINNQILKLNGGSWRNPPKIIKNKYSVFQRAQEFLKSWPKEKIVGFKDPRLCITFPFWYYLTAPEPVKVIYVERPVPEIASSLKKRNGMTLSMGKNLAKTYIMRAVMNIQKTEVSWMRTQYHAFFLPNYKFEIGELCLFAGLKIPDNFSAIDRFIDKKLWHHREGMNVH